MNPKLLLPGPLDQFYNLHPVFVHAPLGFLPGALLLFAAGFWLRREALLSGGRACLWLGTIGAGLAFLVGWRAEGSIPHNETIHSMMQTHKYAALAVLILAVALTAWSLRRRMEGKGERIAFVGVLAALNLLLMAVGDLGARMVYLEGAGVKPAAASITGGSDGEDASGDGHKHSH